MQKSHFARALKFYHTVPIFAWQADNPESSHAHTMLISILSLLQMDSEDYTTQITMDSSNFRGAGTGPVGPAQAGPIFAFAAF